MLFKILPGSIPRQGCKLLHSLLLMFVLRKQIILAAVTCWLKQVKTEEGFRILIADRFIMVCEGWCLPGWPGRSEQSVKSKSILFLVWNFSVPEERYGEVMAWKYPQYFKSRRGRTIKRWKKILGEDTLDITREGWPMLQGTPYSTSLTHLLTAV